MFGGFLFSGRFRQASPSIRFSLTMNVGCFSSLVSRYPEEIGLEGRNLFVRAGPQGSLLNIKNCGSQISQTQRTLG
jgi:hypothetical protein